MYITNNPPKIAAAAGATVIATSSSDSKLEVAKELGATHLVNYRTHPNWEKEVLAVTDGKGADIALETVSGPNIEHTLRAIRRGGLVAFVGMMSSDAKKPVNVMPDLWYGSKTSKYRFDGRRLAAFLRLASRHFIRESCADLRISLVQGLIGTGSKDMGKELVAFVEKHDLHPPIAQTFEFEQAREAWQELATLSKPGKIVINV